MKKFIMSILYILCVIVALCLLIFLPKTFNTNAMHDNSYTETTDSVEIDHNRSYNIYTVSIDLDKYSLGDEGEFIIVENTNTNEQQIGVKCGYTYQYLKIVNSDDTLYKTKIQSKEELLTRFKVGMDKKQNVIITDSKTDCRYVKLNCGANNTLFVLEK